MNNVWFNALGFDERCIFPCVGMCFDNNCSYPSRSGCETDSTAGGGGIGRTEWRGGSIQIEFRVRGKVTM